MVTVVVLCSRSSTSLGWRQEADDRECYPASTLLSMGTAGMAALGTLPPPLVFRYQVGGLEPMKSPNVNKTGLLSVSTSFRRLEADDRECYPASTLLSRGTAGCRRF